MKNSQIFDKVERFSFFKLKEQFMHNENLKELTVRG
ncbi:hypothetical protein HAINFHK1212_2110, partial [Haemophilus influenzae HK1212]